MRRFRLLAGLAAALAVAGCGNAGYDLSEGTFDSDQQARAGLHKIVVADTTGMPAAFVRYGIQRGHFEDQGLAVDFRSSVGGTTVIPLLLSGELDFAGSSAVSAMVAIDRGLPVKIIAPGTSASDSATRDFSSIQVPEDSPIRDVADLSGKRVAVNTLKGINDVIIAGLMDRDGGQFGSLTFVEMPFPDMVVAIERGNVDAALLIEPFATIGLSRGLREIVQPFAALRPGLQIGCYMAADEMVTASPELVAGFQRAVAATAQDIGADPSSFRTALPNISNFDAGMANRIRMNQWKPSHDRPSLELEATLMRRIGFLKKDFNYNQAVIG